jgi:ABC-type branched-subunit amino acid transport system substrate-binding protein
LRCLLGWLLLAPLAGGAGVSQVTLGLVAPPSEPDAASLLRGVQLAVAEANEGGQTPVGLEVRSEEGQWGTAGNDAVILVSERHVDAIISSSDGDTSHLILQVSGRTQVPVASVCSDSSVTAAGVIWAIRVVPRTDQEVEALFAAAQGQGRSPLHWWVVVPAGRPGRAVRHDLGKAARLSSTRLDRVVDDGNPRTDFAALAHQIAEGAPDGVLLWLPPSKAGAMVAALRAAGYSGVLAGPATLDSPAFFAASGAAATGVLVTNFRGDATSIVRMDAFEGRFQRRYDAKPDFSAAAAHDAAQVLIETLRRAQKGAGDRQFPLSTATEGVTGVLHFDSSGNRTDALQVLTCREGRFVSFSKTNP